MSTAYPPGLIGLSGGAARATGPWTLANRGQAGHHAAEANLAEPPQDSSAFKILGPLGHGGMGDVYRALDRAANRWVALKLIRAEQLTPVRRERFRREGQLTASLDHPGIVRVHSAGELNGRPYLAYELVEDCQTFDVAIKQLRLKRRIELVRDVAAASGHAHSRGVVHRDLKPANVLVDSQGVVRIADFGLAIASDLDRLTRTGGLAGTPTHMAPEQFDGKLGQVTPASDVWAIGVILYECLTDRLPFPGTEGLPQLVAAMSESRFGRPRDLVPSLSPDLEAICLRALQRDPSRRYADGAELAADLERYLSGARVHARSDRKPSPRALLGALVVLGALAAVAAWPAHAPQPRPTPPSTRTAQASPTTPTRIDAPAWYQALPAELRPALPPRVGFGSKPGEYHHEQDDSVLVWIPARPDPPLLGFFVGKYELSSAQYGAFRSATGHRAPTDFQLYVPTGDDLPAVGVTWDDAQAYCRWAGLRLPSGEEWERAAVGDDGRQYPWGSEPPGADRANLLGAEDGYYTLSPVDAFPAGASPWGCLGMLGNVNEWVQDSTTGLTPGQVQRVVRGGAWDTPSLDRSARYVRGEPPSYREHSDVGFRVCLSGEGE